MQTSPSSQRSSTPLSGNAPDDGSRSLDDANSIVLRLDGKGRVISLNAFGQQFFGFPASEIVGRPIVGTIVPEKDHNGNNLAAMINDLLQRPEAHRHQINENRRKSGDAVWVVWSNRAFFDFRGKVTELLCVGNDITDRKTFEAVLESARVQLTATVQAQNAQLQESNRRLKKEMAERKAAEQALKESRDRYRLYSMASTEGILFHANGIAIEVNDALAKLCETPREQLIGMDILHHFVSPEDIESVKRKMAANDGYVYEITALTPSGQRFPAELRSWPGELSGRPCRVVSIRDIRQRKKTERQMIQSQKMEAIGTLASGIAHDFNNMLAGIQGNVEIIRHQLSDRSPHQKRLAFISKIVQRGARLSGQLLGYARGGQTEISLIDLNHLVRESLEMFSHAHRQIDIETRLSSDRPTINGDHTQIEQVLLNLVINAVHAMPTGGRIHIETSTTVLTASDDRDYEIVPGRYAMLSVRDTGHGMDADTRKKIFEPFFTTKPEGQGTGLGLASAYGIVKNHKGYIDVFSKPGAGSQFNVLLPSAQAALQPNPKPEPHAQESAETILLIDDEPDFLDVGRDMLILLGYQVVTATDMTEAEKRLQSADGTVKTVILDMAMPGPGAEMTVTRLRQQAPTVPLLLTSGYGRNGDTVRKLMPYCQGFIPKPFRLTELSNAIRTARNAAPIDRAAPP
ncbi:hypothetical protein DSCO28_69790 [Desulfosarcina ovata subsp. sediminis]|uniref:histidine kinase n=1 Tax=Desulfosarcina ovata subsp. sediminis TaxID=885957 RepID=A0A5K8A1J9_9BACT|nr:PAS domain-containing sensor histidine kinase [Desulfosarcina ovata]BBO86413.1 hypothetical protein DSCO28_69790 [Desulfosarcina ovata subsp. sediminis]